MGKSLKYLGTGCSSNDNDDSFESESKCCFWESQLYYKSYFREKNFNNGYPYYDNYNCLKFLFFHWLNKWISLLSRQYVEPYKLHPLPIADQILYWQPIFSKHVSDGLIKLEANESWKSKGDKNDNSLRDYNRIFLGSIFLTFSRRLIILISGIIIINLMSMSISFLVKRLLKFLNDKSLGFFKIILLLLTIIILQIADGIFLDNISLETYKMVYILHGLVISTVFQHRFCCRPKYFNSIEGSNFLGVCNEVVHSCSPDSECSKNPFFCPALRYQNRDMDGKCYAILAVDSFYTAMIFESVKLIIEFLSNFIYGVLLISFQVKVNLWVLYVVGLIIVLLMVVIEIVIAWTSRCILSVCDYRYTATDDIVSSLPIINKMFVDDIAYNMITRSRNKELYFYCMKNLLTFFNMTMYTVFINVSFYLVKRYFVKSVNSTEVITSINVSGFLTTFYILQRIINSVLLIPYSIKGISNAYVCYVRILNHMKECSPNFYISDNKFTGKLKMTSEISVVTNKINKDIVVLYRDASFAWVNSRNDLLNKNYNPYLKNINFELKRGEIVIVTGAQGSGKSNFVKSALGEMTLVGGSMAVVPLHTSMPIFYASQDVWLKKGTVRTNITFGYKFDEVLYNKVLKAVELEFDISTWEGGEMRKLPDDAHTLSGGQRVRMELARALYAYLVFSQVNKQYNNGKCSFLMCLDSPFLSLDPFVSKIVFNNLFNIKSGLLVNDDLSVILTSTEMLIEKCMTYQLKQFPEIAMYNIKNQTLSFYCYLSDFINDSYVRNHNYKYLSQASEESHDLNYFSSDMIDLCLFGVGGTKNRMKTKTKYDQSFAAYFKQNLSGTKFNPYLVYISPVVLLFVVYLFIILTLTVMDNVKFIIATNLSDYLNKNINDYNNGQLVDMSKIKSHTDYSFKVVTILVCVIIFLSVLSTILITISSIICSRKIHEYCMDSVFKNSTEVLKLKEEVSKIISFVSADIIIIDFGCSYYVSLSMMSLVQTLISVGTMFYLIPLSIPIVSFVLIIIFKFVFLSYILCVENIQYAYLETIMQIVGVCENAVSGSSIYRSYKKESELVRNIIEHSEYKLRCMFVLYSLRTWVSILFNWIFSVATTLVLVIPIIFDRYTKYKLKVGYFGLALTLSANIIRTFTKFSILYSRSQISMCSIQRFRYFIPPGSKCVFGKSVNTEQEYLLVNYNSDHDYKIDRNKILKRRLVEFNSDDNKFLRSNRLFHRPKISIVDVTKYLTPEHRGVELKDVCVYTSAEHKDDGMILRNVSASAHRSDIIGIIGRTGAGKTTLLSVLENTVENRTGQVLLDGTDLSVLPKNILRQVIGVLPQLPFVFRGWTVRRFIDPRKLFSDNDINEALDKCGLLDLVNNLEGGKNLDSIILPDILESSVQSNNVTSLNVENLKEYYEHRNMLLSNSQLRTLSFARLVLYRYFYRVIVVDEPPEEDCENDKKERNNSPKPSELGIPIYELLKKYFKHCTTFVTAHDENVLRFCTSIWAMHEGQIIRFLESEDISANESISNFIEQMIKQI